MDWTVFFSAFGAFLLVVLPAASTLYAQIRKARTEASAAAAATAAAKIEAIEKAAQAVLDKAAATAAEVVRQAAREAVKEAVVEANGETPAKLQEAIDKLDAMREMLVRRQTATPIYHPPAKV